MAFVECRECSREVSDQATACPHCGAPFPGNPSWDGTGFEYRSALTLWGLPVLHVAVGRSRYRRRRVAKGIIAVGQYAIGLVAIGQFAVGVATLGQFALGVWCVGQFGIGGWVLAQFALGGVVLAQFGVAVVAGIGMKIWSIRELFGP